MNPLFPRLFAAVCLAATLPETASGQATTAGFLNQARPEAPGTLLSHPDANGSRQLGRTTTLNYVNGWLLVGGESPGSAPGSDLRKRVYDISNPAAPVRRHPSDFGLSYPHGDYWIQNSDGWDAHGSAQSGTLQLPLVMDVPTFGGPVRLGGYDGVPQLTDLQLGYNRSSQAGPWEATMLWYGTPAQTMRIRRPMRNVSGIFAEPFQVLASFDHTGPFGGGDWHPMFFGDLLIYARSGAAARDGVVVYRLQYHHFEDADPANDTITPHFVGSLDGGFAGYWPNLFSDGTGLHVIGSATDILTSADITRAAHPLDTGEVRQGPVLTIPGFSNASYPVYQDQFAFIHNRKINLTDFLAGRGLASIVLTLDEAGTGVDTTQISLPLGNLWITGGYPNGTLAQGMGVWVHQQAPDTTPPTVAYHIPQANRTDYPRAAPLSFLIHEQPRRGGPRNGIDFTVRPVAADGETLGAFMPGFLIHDFSGVLTFTPSNALAAATTYQVDFLRDTSDPQNPVGFQDTAGNALAPYSFRFSTGGEVAALPPPSITNLVANPYQPLPGQAVHVTAAGQAGAGGGLEFRFNFGGVWTAWSTTGSTNHVYASTGRQRVLAQVREDGGVPVTAPLNLLVLAPPAGPQPTRSSSVVVGDDPAGRRVWVVNPDADSVSVHAAETGAKIAEHTVGRTPRSIARDALGRYWVACSGDDRIHLLDSVGGNVHTLVLPYGARPFGVVASPDGQWIYVSLEGSGRVRRYRADQPGQAPVETATFPTPRALAVSGDGTRLLVTRFISDELQGEVAEFAASAPGLDWVRTFRLESASTIDNGDRAAGVPNYLTGIAISPDGTRAAVVSKQDNTRRGTLFGTGDLTFENTVRAVVSFLDLNANAEIRHARRDFDNADSPSAVAYTPLGDTLLVTLQGNNRVVGFDALSLEPVTGVNTAGATLTSPVVKTLEAATGRAPQGVWIDPTTRRMFTQNFMGRSLTVLDAEPLLARNQGALPVLATASTVAAEPLSTQVLAGKRVFYNAADARMSAEGYISCATCHLDGGHDGRVWDFTGRGEGLRRTTDLRGRAGTGHGNVHWSGNFDEIQDFEHDIRGAFGGGGFLTLDATAFAAQHPSPATAKAGLSAELDALAAYVASLGTNTVPRSPHRAADGALTAAGLRGRAVFAQQNCVACHAGTAFTDSAVHAVASTPLCAVGTTSALSGQRLGASLAGLDTPTLLGLHASRVFLHHGQASALDEVFAHTGGTLFTAAAAQRLGSAGVEVDDPNQGGGGFLRGVVNGAMVAVNGAGSGVRFTGVDGGAGGAGRIAWRYARPYSDEPGRVRVNGTDSAVTLLRQYPDNGWMTSGWRWDSLPVNLLPGAANTVEVLRGNAEYGDFNFNALLVSGPADLAAAEPHRRVLGLSESDRADLLAYLLQLDGSAQEAPAAGAPAAPTVSLALTAGQATPLAAAFVDIDITFSAPVTGLAAAEIQLGGNTGASLRHLTALPGGAAYRLRVAGMTQAGTLTVQVPAAVAQAVTGGTDNAESAPLGIVHAPPVTDDAAPLSDEFGDPATLAQWKRNEVEEGWNAGKLQQWNIHTTTPGHMRLMPYSSTWYQDFTGAYAYKEITGDFVLSTRLRVTNRAGTGRPNSAYSLCGLMVRAARGVTRAAPQPNPGPGTVLPWPPSGYTTDWSPGTENYIFLSFGFGDAGAPGHQANRWQYEVKTTVNGVSTLYPRSLGVPDNEPQADLQIVRRGSTFLLLRRHGNAGAWIIENRFERPDFPATLQIGLTTYTDWNFVSAGWNFSSPVQPYHQNRIVNAGVGNPDLIADVDFVRLRRPEPALTAGALQAVAVTGPNGPLRALSATPLAAWLGDPAVAPVVDAGESYPVWISRQLAATQLANPALTDPLADAFAGGQPNLFHFLLGGAPAPLPALVDGGPDGLLYQFPRNPRARGWRLFAETSTNLTAWTEVAASVNGGAPAGAGLHDEVPGATPVVRVHDGDPAGSSSRRYYRLGAQPAP